MAKQLETVARFWTYHEGFVKLTVVEGQPLHWSTRGPTDEGWASRSETWWVEGYTLFNRTETDGVDCDGRLSTCDVYSCSFDDLDSHETPEGVKTPEWSRVSGRQRDYSAEAMGY